jgi:mannose PTS system EIIA component
MSILILTHGDLGRELLTAARTIAGDLPDAATLCLEWDDTPEQADEKLAAAIQSLTQAAARNGGGERGGVLILTDLYGSTPTNAALKHLAPGRIEVLTGVNLPMVVRLACAHRRDLEVGELAHWLQKKGRDAVCVASDRIGSRSRPPHPTSIAPCAEDEA